MRLGSRDTLGNGHSKNEDPLEIQRKLTERLIEVVKRYRLAFSRETDEILLAAVRIGVVTKDEYEVLIDHY